MGGDVRKYFWPKYLLPQACPTARILSFGYNAEFAHFFPFYGPKFMPEQLTIDDHSIAFFQSLIGLCEKTKTVKNKQAYLLFRRNQADKVSISRQIAL